MAGNATLTTELSTVTTAEPRIADSRIRRSRPVIQLSNLNRVRPCVEGGRRRCERAHLAVSPDERQRRLCDLAPAVVDREGVAAVRHLQFLGHALVLLLALVRRVRDRPWDGVVGV